jgi:hypothetical protein
VELYDPSPTGVYLILVFKVRSYSFTNAKVWKMWISRTNQSPIHGLLGCSTMCMGKKSSGAPVDQVVASCTRGNTTSLLRLSSSLRIRPCSRLVMTMG